MTGFPSFFSAAPVVLMRDSLAEFLGAANEGLIEYRFEDAVRLAGHSCPTVAAAFLMVRSALAAIYPGEVPCRGAIRVEFRERRDAGVTGVMAAVATLLTGAAGDGGFKGLAGRHVRRNLLSFDAPISADLRLTRLDTGARSEVSARLDRVPGDPRMGELLPICMGETASSEERTEFARLWQDRVRRLLLEHADDPQVIVVTV